MRRCRAAWWAALALGTGATVGPTGAQADPLPGSPCIAEPDPQRRLACYDRQHGRQAASPLPASAGAPAVVPAVVPPPAQGAAAPVASGGFRTASITPARRASRLAEAWDLDVPRSADFAPRAYRPVYLLPATWTDRVNRRPSSPAPEHTVPFDLALKSVEAKYQLSLKARFGDRILGTPISVWGAYTQSSRWQLYNGAASRPFRETNYEPEVMAVLPMQLQLLGWQWRMSAVSLAHQSNGRALPLSRSWNRVIATLAFERDDWLLELRPWVRLRENPADDDNPDIADYIGRGELRLSRSIGDQVLSAQLRHSLRGGDRSRGSLQLDWVFPLSGALHGYFQIFSGYGESLVDYNQQQSKWGLGVTIAGWR